MQRANVIIVGGFGGRLDQEVANIHALFKWHSLARRIVLIGTLYVIFGEVVEGMDVADALYAEYG